jgi:hypothetical protein
MGPRRTSRRHGRALALALAVCVHLLTFLALGWRIPTVAPLQDRDTLPPVEVTLERITPRPAAPSAAPPASMGRAAKPSPARPSSAETPGPSAPAVAAPAAPQVAGAVADCAPEDLPLLTEAEKARCRNQIDADKARRLARGADERAAEEMAEADRGQKTFRADADREAYYDALVKAQQSPGLPMVGPGVSCSHVTFPLLSGVEINKNIFAHKGKQEHKAHGPGSCKGVL